SRDSVAREVPRERLELRLQHLRRGDRTDGDAVERMRRLCGTQEDVGTDEDGHCRSRVNSTAGDLNLYGVAGPAIELKIGEELGSQVISEYSGVDVSLVAGV